MTRKVEQFIWIDSHTHAGWLPEESILSSVDVPMIVSVGFVIEESAVWIVLATTVADTFCLSPVFIPKRAVLERDVLCEVETE
jgi:hypothetical protein